MAKVVEATGDGACLFNAVSIGLGIEILSGRLDDHKDSLGYLRLLDVLAEHHPQFNPKSWNNLKQWLLYYNNSRDWELILAPVLFKLNQKYQAKLENEVLNDLANFIRDNKANIEDQQPIYLLNFNKCPKIDNLTLQAKRELLASILPIIKDWDQNQDFIVFRQLVSTRAQAPLNNLIDLIKADQNAFQMGYGCHDLKGMVDSLHLTLVENQTGSYLTDMNTKIYLRNREQHWDVVVSDDDFSRLSFGVQQLSMASLDAFHGLKQVASPMQEHSSEHSELTESSASSPQNLTAQAIETPVEAKQGNDSSTAATDNDEARLKHLKR